MGNAWSNLESQKSMSARAFTIDELTDLAKEFIRSRDNNNYYDLFCSERHLAAGVLMAYPRDEVTGEVIEETEDLGFIQWLRLR